MLTNINKFEKFNDLTGEITEKLAIEKKKKRASVSNKKSTIFARSNLIREISDESDAIEEDI